MHFPLLLLFCSFFILGPSWAQGQHSSAKDNSIAANADNGSTIIIHQHLTDPKAEERGKTINQLQGQVKQQQDLIDWLQLNPIQTLIKQNNKAIVESLPTEERQALLSGNPAPAASYLEKMQREAETAARLTSKRAAQLAFEIALLFINTDQDRALEKIQEAIKLDSEQFEYHIVLLLLVYSDTEADEIERHPSWTRAVNFLKSEQSSPDPQLAAIFHLLEVQLQMQKGQFSRALRSIANGKAKLGRKSNTEQTGIAIESDAIFDIFQNLISLLAGENDTKSFTEQLRKTSQQVEERLNSNCKNCLAAWHIFARLQLLDATISLDSGETQQAANLTAKVISIASQLSAHKDHKIQSKATLQKAYLLRSRIELAQGKFEAAINTAKQTLNNALADRGKRKREDLAFVLETIEHAMRIERNTRNSPLEIEFYRETAKDEVSKASAAIGSLRRAEANYILANILYYADDASGRLQALISAEELVSTAPSPTRTFEAFYLKKKIRYALLRSDATSQPARSQKIIDDWKRDLDALELAMNPKRSLQIERSDIIFEQIRHNGIHISCKSTEALFKKQREILSTEWDKSSTKSAADVASRFDESFKFELACSNKQKALDVAEQRLAYARVDYLNGNNLPEHHVFSAHTELMKQFILNDESERLADHAETLWMLSHNCKQDENLAARCLERQGSAYMQLGVFSDNEILSNEYFSLARARLEKSIQHGQKNSQTEYVNSTRETLISALTIEAARHPNKISHARAVELYQTALAVFSQLPSSRITKPMERWKRDLTNWIASRDQKPFSIEPWNYYGETILSSQRK